jgi:hypothetical protein
VRQFKHILKVFQINQVLYQDQVGSQAEVVQAQVKLEGQWVVQAGKILEVE